MTRVEQANGLVVKVKGKWVEAQIGGVKLTP
jgi:hypothetical protein